MDQADIPRLNEYFLAQQVPAESMDLLWANGWRHFGSLFFRYSHVLNKEEETLVHPLRLDLGKFAPTISQRRILRRNADLEVVLGPPQQDDERRLLFELHKCRFKENVPEKLENFLGTTPFPCECLELVVRESGRLVAASYLDVGQRAVSSVYAFFDPAMSRRSLGIFTLLQEIRFAQEQKLDWLYPGYAYAGKSSYDYKKRLGSLENYDWTGNWTIFPAN